MSRLLWLFVVWLFTVSLLVAAPIGLSPAIVSAQSAVPIPGTHTRLALPRGCGVSGPGSITCGTERVDIGGSSLGFDELLAAHRASGHVVQTPGAGLFVTSLASGQLLIVRDGVDERLLVLGTTSAPRAEAGQTLAWIALGIELPTAGPIVSGFAALSRDRLPYATVYWNDGSLTFTSSAIGTDDRAGTSGFLRETQRTTMIELCDNRAISDRMPATLLLRHQRRLSELVSVCEEAFVVDLGARRMLAAQFGYVLHDGHAYSLTMTYGLEPSEEAVGCLEGFEHFALPVLSDVLGLEGDEGDDDDGRRARHGRR